jgi:hypothetical protein
LNRLKYILSHWSLENKRFVSLKKRRYKNNDFAKTTFTKSRNAVGNMSVTQKQSRAFFFSQKHWGRSIHAPPKPHSNEA